MYVFNFIKGTKELESSLSRLNSTSWNEYSVWTTFEIATIRCSAPKIDITLQICYPVTRFLFLSSYP